MRKIKKEKIGNENEITVENLVFRLFGVDSHGDATVAERHASSYSQRMAGGPGKKVFFGKTRLTGSEQVRHRARGTVLAGVPGFQTSYRTILGECKQVD